MNPNREEARFALALEKLAEKRPAFLDAVCEGDTALRARLEALRSTSNALTTSAVPFRSQITSINVIVSITSWLHPIGGTSGMVTIANS